MTGFGHRIEGTPESSWQARGFTDLAELDAPAAGDRVLVVAAHPDDETLGAGGLIALAAARGAQVRVVIATDGEASHPGSRTHSPAELARIRQAEVRAAVATLAPTVEPSFLGLPDGGLAQHGDELDAALAPLVGDCTHVVTPWSRDRHPDHEACAESVGRIGADGAQHWQYPIWAWHWDEPAASVLPRGHLRGLALDAATLATKRRALAQHRSQVAALSDAPGDEAIVPPEVAAHFERDVECFVLVPPAADPAYFDRLYATADDPWGLAARFYERRKRELVLASLPRERFARAFEPGCATGLLTAELARRCDDVVAWDAAAAAVAQASGRVAGTANVQVAQGSIPGSWPDGEFDLLVLSEVGYYCDDLDALAARIDACLADDGAVLAVHWRHPAVDHPQTADNVHRVLGRQRYRLVQHAEPDFLLDVWTNRATSVAAAEGIVGPSRL